MRVEANEWIRYSLLEFIRFRQLSKLIDFVLIKQRGWWNTPWPVCSLYSFNVHWLDSDWVLWALSEGFPSTWELAVILELDNEFGCAWIGWCCTCVWPFACVCKSLRNQTTRELCVPPFMETTGETRCSHIQLKPTFLSGTHTHSNSLFQMFHCFVRWSVRSLSCNLNLEYKMMMPMMNVCDTVGEQVDLA